MTERKNTMMEVLVSMREGLYKIEKAYSSFLKSPLPP
jgi:hypothetical protein